MSNSNKYNHIYVEKDVINHQLTSDILNKFPKANIIFIDHYKDVFNRKNQDYKAQHQNQNLILAANRETHIYPGSPVCQNFDNRYFYYCSQVMNCVYDCSYCYLKGMYPSGNLVIFVNIEDIFKELETLLIKHPVYLCISYDSDLLALENITGFVKKWHEFTLIHENLSVELRTKSGSKQIFSTLEPCSRFIFAYTMTPDNITKAFEPHTPLASARLDAMKKAYMHQHPLRLCLDPVLPFTKTWQKDYTQMIDDIFKEIPADYLKDVSIGSFRISKDYLKLMRKRYPDSAVIHYPYECSDGFYHLPDKLQEETEGFITNEILKYMNNEKIFRWKGSI